MDRATPIGIGLGIVAILTANVMEGGTPMSLLLFPPILLVFGGTIGAALAGGTMSDGKHAVHIHQYGKCEPCADAGGHHDPGPFGHQAPDTNTEAAPASDVNHPFHMGDLINLEVKNGKGKMKHVTNRVTLSPGRLGILDEDGSAFIIRVDSDAGITPGTFVVGNTYDVVGVVSPFGGAEHARAGVGEVLEAEQVE